MSGIWDLDTVGRMMRAYTSQYADTEQFAEAEEFFTGELIRTFRRGALPLLVGRQDVEIIRNEAPALAFMRLQLIARWRPQTHAVEFQGGTLEGRVFAIKKVGDPIEAPVYERWDHLANPGEEYVPRAQRYDLAGWNPETGRWVYRLHSTRHGHV